MYLFSVIVDKLPRKRAQSTKVNELHATGALFTRQIEAAEPAPADLVDFAMAEASDDEDDAPMPDAPSTDVTMMPNMIEHRRTSSSLMSRFPLGCWRKEEEQKTTTGCNLTETTWKQKTERHTRATDGKVGTN